jgi:hypothetical protein
MKSAFRAKVMVVILLCGTMTWTACSAEAWIGEAEQIAAALIPAVGNLVAVAAAVQGDKVSAGDMQTIQNAGSLVGANLQLLQSLMTAYQKADVAARPGLLNQVQTAIGAAQANLNGLLPVLHIKDAAAQAKISAVLGLVTSEVDSLAAIVPWVNSKASPGMMAMAVIQAKKSAPLTARDFVSSYNSTMAAKSGDAVLDHATAGMQIHMHAKVVRWASVGLLK